MKNTYAKTLTLGTESRTVTVTAEDGQFKTTGLTTSCLKSLKDAVEQQEKAFYTAASQRLETAARVDEYLINNGFIKTVAD